MLLLKSMLLQAFLGLTVWTDAIAILEGVWSIIVALLAALETALATSVFIQILFAVIVFSIGAFVFSKVVKLVKSIGGK
jgi:hypothetical protein